MDKNQALAEALLPKYMAWSESLDYDDRGHSVNKIGLWVVSELSETSSYITIDDVVVRVINLLYGEK